MNYTYPTTIYIRMFALMYKFLVENDICFTIFASDFLHGKKQQLYLLQEINTHVSKYFSIL